MATEGTVSRMPSGLMARGGISKPAESAPASASYGGNGEGAGSRLPLLLSVIAVLISLGALYFSLATPHGLTADDRAQLSAITDDLRAIQSKQITLTSPLQTTVYIDQSFPASDIFPSNFALPLSFDVPIDTTVTAQSNTGQLVPLHINDSLEVRTAVPLDLNKTLSGVPITISKEIPIDTHFSVTMQVSAVYGKELNDLINRLDNLSNSGTSITGGQ
ncbi:MAG: hypothetical protein KGH63_03465 [Candidatus Micrarchaeota archaeon]|nr:hypothetical protein [Candidatus Micrarchaeota archaeon]